MAGVSGSSLGNMSDQAATSFTHHLYHHFDRTADRAGMFFPYFFFQQIYSSWAELDLFQSACLGGAFLPQKIKKISDCFCWVSQPSMFLDV